MSWRVHANPKSIPAGTPVKAWAGENVIYGVVGTHASDNWFMVKFPVQPSEPFLVNLNTWTIATEILTFWDVMEDADIGTTAQRKDDTAETVYVKLQDSVVNARTRGVVDPGSHLASLEATSFGWTDPTVWFPSNT